MTSNTLRIRPETTHPESNNNIGMSVALFTSPLLLQITDLLLAMTMIQDASHLSQALLVCDALCLTAGLVLSP